MPTVDLRRKEKFSYCGRQEEPADYSWSAVLYKLYSEVLYSWDAGVVLANMHGMWPRRP